MKTVCKNCRWCVRALPDNDYSTVQRGFLRPECAYNPPSVFLNASRLNPVLSARPVVGEGDFCHLFEGRTSHE